MLNHGTTMKGACSMNINQLLEFDRLAREDGHRYDKKRVLYHSIVRETGAHFIGAVGPRGVGKTIMLKQLALENQGSFYISLDMVDGNLFEIIKVLHETMQIKLFLLDEVHAIPRFESEIKKIYDVFQPRGEANSKESR